MKIYKYRDFSQPDESAFVRFERIVGHRAVWCASPASLNDPEEFAWKCDSSVSPDTAELLTELLVRLKGRPREDARRRVLNTINVGRLRVLVKPVIAAMIRQSRDGIGLACFGTSHDNDTLWKRYAGDGAGVCVEIELPDQLLGAQLRRVIYSDDRPIHVDHFLRARFDPRYARVVYEASLLSKTILWAPEEEIRFLSKSQQKEIVIDGSVITRVILGPALRPSATARIRRMAGCIPVVPRGAVPVTAQHGTEAGVGFPVK